jgi:hypothetical protein
VKRFLGRKALPDLTSPCECFSRLGTGYGLQKTSSELVSLLKKNASLAQKKMQASPKKNASLAQKICSHKSWDGRRHQEIRPGSCAAVELYGCTAVRPYGCTAVRLYGRRAARPDGCTDVRLYGRTYGCMAGRLHGRTLYGPIRPYGRMNRLYSHSIVQPCSCTAVWLHGCRVITVRPYGSTAVQLYGCTAVRPYSHMAVQLYGPTSVRLYGRTDVWPYKKYKCSGRMYQGSYG